ncbi:MAG: DUF1553 domain-containing protein [Blastocatellia bacterium]
MYTVSTAVSRDGATLTPQKDNSINASGKNPPDDLYTVTLTLNAGMHTALRLEVLPEKRRMANGRWGAMARRPTQCYPKFSAELLNAAAPQRLRLITPRADFADANGSVTNALDDNERTGWSVLTRTHEPHEAIFTFAEPLQLSRATQLRVTLLQQAGDNKTLRRFRLSTTAVNPTTLQPQQPAPAMRKLHDEVTAAYKAQKDFNDSLVRLPLMRELAADKQRKTHIQRRGNFLDPGDEVKAGVPASFHSFPADAPRNRLGVAAWLVSRDNPLTPRVWANRIWARLFGVGIVETEEDFGALGAAPTNPDLLDWLAAEYRDHGWSLKKLLKTIVMSKTYQQASDVTNALRESDPRNLLQSRGARFRLGAEAVRDQALAVAGLLSSKMGGPPVMPPQPAGLWRSTYNGKKWIDAEGQDRYRRGLYTYLKRTTPYPSFLTFDGGSGEICQIRRIRTNTPLQSLVTLNDPVYLEAAAGLAKRMVAEAKIPAARAAYGLRLALIRPVQPREALPLLALQRDAQKDFLAAPEKAEALLKSARATVPSGIGKAALAAWIVTANAILNLDEFLTRN